MEQLPASFIDLSNQLLDAARGVTDDGHSWTRWTDEHGMPRATNVYFSRERLDIVVDELRAKEA